MKFNFLLLFCLSAFVLKSQNSIGWFSTLDYGSLTESAPLRFFEDDYKTTGGIIYRKSLNERWNLSYQLKYESVGWIVKDYVDRSGTKSNIDLYWKGSGLSISVGGEYYLINKKHLRFGVLSQPGLGYMLSQEFRVVELLPGNTNFSINRNLLVKLEMKMILDILLTPDFTIFLRPGFVNSFYFDKNDYTARIYSMDVGLSFYLNN